MECRASGCSLNATSSGFCHGHTTQLDRDSLTLAAELAVFLRAHAGFAAWCETHGRPNPHDE